MRKNEEVADNIQQKTEMTNYENNILNNIQHKGTENSERRKSVLFIDKYVNDVWLFFSTRDINDNKIYKLLKPLYK